MKMGDKPFLLSFGLVLGTLASLAVCFRGTFLLLGSAGDLQGESPNLAFIWPLYKYVHKAI